jgi:hypothetical protein
MKTVIRINICLLGLAIVLAPGATLAAAQCASFAIVPTPNPGSDGNSLVAVAAVGDGTAWAAGTQSDGGSTALILHFDGSQWNEVPLPSEADGIFFTTACNTPEGDVWMIGTRPHTVYQVEVFCLRGRNGAIERTDSFLNGGGPISISATAADDVWAVSVGLWPVDQGGYVQHFDGSDWSIMQLPAEFSYRNDPQAIYAAGPDDVWIAGLGGNSRAEYRGYLQHWDGSSWELVSTPFDGQELVFFESIDGSSGNGIWVAGHLNYSEDLLMHYDGSSWTHHPGTPVDEPLKQVVVAAPDNSWASPYSLMPGSPFFYWDGSSWSPDSAPEVPGAVTVNWRALSQAGQCEVWAVGSYNDGGNTHTLAARLDAGGNSTSDAGEGGPRAATLLGNHPNPFNPSTVISFELASRQNTVVGVYSVDGRLVRTLSAGVRDAGVHRVNWDGRDASGRQVASGTYLYMIRHGEGTLSGKMVMTK